MEKANREELVELLKGGFAPVVILLREFDYKKAGIVLDGLHFSAWGLLEHMRWRQLIFLEMLQYDNNQDLWPEPYWPENNQLQSQEQWNHHIDMFEHDLQEIIDIISNPETDLFNPMENGKSAFWVAVATLQHNGYHIGQMKALGRQLGVW